MIYPCFAKAHIFNWLYLNMKLGNFEIRINLVIILNIPDVFANGRKANKKSINLKRFLSLRGRVVWPWLTKILQRKCYVRLFYVYNLIGNKSGVPLTSVFTQEYLNLRLKYLVSQKKKLLLRCVASILNFSWLLINNDKS